ncbi:MAG: hypothetical protein EPO24_06660 [Bacteroidetes bacterium]|nr:MAG: hypothetical protein EPO24_06660 [Bacteroidota bacterium]
MVHDAPVKRIKYVFFFTLCMITITYPQTERDSLLDYLYKKGLINEETFLRSRPKEVIEKEKRQRIVESQQRIIKMRDSLNNKFVIDFLLTYKANNDKPHIDTSTFEWVDEIRLVKSNYNKKHCVEQFQIGGYFTLYKIPPSKDSLTYYILIDSSSPGNGSFYLFENNLSKWIFLDHFEIRSRGCHFIFSTLNGCNIIKTSRMSWGTGYILEEEVYRSIMNGKFNILFSSRPAELTLFDGVNETCIIRNVDFVDINQDGFLDIVEEETMQNGCNVEFGQIQHVFFLPEDERTPISLDPEAINWKKVSRYYWNNESFSFEEE